MSTRIVFIDSRISNYKTLVAGLPIGTEYVVLDLDFNGLEQISAALQGRSGLEAIDIISYGTPGTVTLGSTQLNGDNLGSYSELLAEIGSHLTDKGDIRLYGSNVAQGETGQAFIERLAQLAGADVAASTDLTGASALGGDWVLEAQAGIIEAANAQLSYDNVLLESSINSAPTFAVGLGKLTTDIGGIDSGHSVTVQTDGKILVAGTSSNGDSGDFALVRYNADGSLDTSFDFDGKLTTDIGGNDSGGSITVQADGKILVAGTSWNGNDYDFALVRYNVDGSLDTSFDFDGKLTTDFSSYDLGRSATVQADGKILVAGSISNNDIYDFALVRYNADGSLDTSFGFDGKVVTNIDAYDDGYSVTVQADGKILLAGYSDDGSSKYTRFSLIRYNADGSLDTSFSSDGKLTTSIFGWSDYGRSVTVQADGKILVAGSSWNGNNDDFALVRYNVDGSLDTSFSGDGKVTTAISTGSWDSGSSVTVQADGKILVAGYSSKDGNNSSSDFVLVRYNADGSLDTSFSGDGKLTTAIGNSYDYGNAVTLQADGKILVAGSSFNGSNSDFALVRYNADGSLDKSFNPVNTLDGMSSYSENSTPVVLDADVRIFDAELASANNYAGASLTLARSGGASAEDSFSFSNSTLFTATGTELQANGQTFASFSQTNGALSINFTSSNTPATQALVNDVLQHISYSNTSEAPPASVQIDWSFSDGDTSNPQTVIGSTTTKIIGINDAPVVKAPLVDQAVKYETSGWSYNAAASFTDIDQYDGASLSFSATLADGNPLPVWLHIDTTTGLITTDFLQLADRGIYALTVTATDSGGLSVSTPLNIAVTLFNAGHLLVSTTSDDVLLGSAANDTVSYGYATAPVTVSLATTSPQNTDGAGNDTLSFIDNLIGSDYNDNLTGNGGANVLDGGLGIDALMGMEGDDIYIVDNIDDIITENTSVGTDSVLSFVDYTLAANVESLTLLGTAPISGTGNSLANKLTGNIARNNLNGGAGNDIIMGEGGADTMAGGAGADIMSGGDGDDIMAGGAGDDTMTGGMGADIIAGGFGSDNLNGGAGNDKLEGENGNDILTGGSGKDTLTGGRGNDIFDFNALSQLGLGAANRDAITDFTSGQDKIDLSTIDADSGLTGDQAFSFITSAFTAAGQVSYSGGIISINTDADTASEFEIELTGTVPASLSAADFVL